MIKNIITETAQEEHICSLCMKPILKGTEYHKVKGFAIARLHQGCLPRFKTLIRNK